MRANDTRPDVANQIRSLGAEFVPVHFDEQGIGEGGYAKLMSEGFQKAQRDVFARQAMDVDIIVTTAQIPGRPAPKLITAGMVESMKPGIATSATTGLVDSMPPDRYNRPSEMPVLCDAVCPNNRARSLQLWLAVQRHQHPRRRWRLAPSAKWSPEGN